MKQWFRLRLCFMWNHNDFGKWMSKFRRHYQTTFCLVQLKFKFHPVHSLASFHKRIKHTNRAHVDCWQLCCLNICRGHIGWVWQQCMRAHYDTVIRGLSSCTMTLALKEKGDNGWHIIVHVILPLSENIKVFYIF